MKKVLVPVVVGQGLFSNEVQVTLDTSAGSTVSLFVDESLVETRGVHKFLTVFSSAEDKDKTASILLPSEAFETSSRWTTAAIVPA